MNALRDDVSRIADDLAKRAGPLGRELIERARPYADDLIGRAKPVGKDLLDRARPYADSLSARARPYADSISARASAYADDLTNRFADRAEDIIRQARRNTALAAAPEPRSFLDTPGGKVAAGAALGVLAGLAFGAVRKAAVQGAEALAGDWQEVLKAEHRAVDKLFEQLLATDDRQKVRRAYLLHRISSALAKHAAQEEMALYPALKESTGDAPAMHLYEDHARIKIFIHELNDIPKDAPEWIERARAFQACVAHHVREEEDEIFPAYHARVSPQQNSRVTLQVHKEGLKLA